MDAQSYTIPDMVIKFLSMKEAAEKLGVSRSYVHLLKNTRQLKAQRIGKQWVISEKELERYKSTRNQKTEGGEQ